MAATYLAPLTPSDKPLTGVMLWLAALALAAANFVVVLDMTIANVSVPSIAGDLGVATGQGSWIITSYAVAEAITVPLVGWLTARFGAVRVFSVAMGLFGLASLLCGVANSLGLLVFARILQGLAGGPLMPLSQILLLRIFPPRMAPAAIGLWSMTTLLAPVLGPVVGGWICDQYSWHVIFLINVPIALGCAVLAANLLKRYELPLHRYPIDKVGLVLLVVWVGALQLMLGEGKDLDWFASPLICALAAVAAVGFAAFLIWVLHEERPIVDLRVLRHRGFTLNVLVISWIFGTFTAASLLTPLWLQGFMGYTPTRSGLVVAWMGLFALFVAYLAARLTARVDGRRLVFAGLLWMAGVTFWRSLASTDLGYWDIALPMMCVGLGLPFLFIPGASMALASVDEREMENAAGLMSFWRILSGAAAISLVNTVWESSTARAHHELVGVTDQTGKVLQGLEQSGMSAQSALQTLDHLVTSQSVMLATNQIMLAIAVCYVVAACVVWLAPRPLRVVLPGADAY
ncbi:MAG: MDR family MFS transporter [Comamonas sp.]